MSKRNSIYAFGLGRAAGEAPAKRSDRTFSGLMGPFCVLILVLNIGCHKSEADVARRSLVEAEAVIHSAKLSGAGEAAPSDLEIAEAYYKKAVEEIQEAGALEHLIAEARQTQRTTGNASLAKKKAQDAMEKVKIQNEGLKLSNQALRDKLDSIRHTVQSIQKDHEARNSDVEIAITPEVIYENAFHQFKQNDFPSAEASFRSFLELFPDHELSDNAQYWIGECRYSIREYRKALLPFSMVLETYPDGNKAPDAQLKIGLCYKYLGNQKQASESFNRTIRNYPDSNAAKLAKKLLNQME